MKYFAWKGMEKIEIEGVDSVGLIMDNGDRVELQYRKSDGEISLDCNHQLVIEPRATNVVRLKVRR